VQSAANGADRTASAQRHGHAPVGHGIPAALSEVTTLTGTLKRRSADVLANVERTRASNGRCEAIKGRL
jgi:hypothetical protein